MFKYLVSAAVAAVALTAPASALVVSVSGPGGTADTSYSSAGSLAVDPYFESFDGSGRSVITANVTLEDADLGSTLDFSSLVGNGLGFNLTSLLLDINGATFSALGDVVPGFSGPAIVSMLGEDVLITFAEPGEGYGAELGFNSPFLIDISSLQAGDSFDLTFLANADVPAPAALGLLALGLGAVSLRRKAAL